MPSDDEDGGIAGGITRRLFIRISALVSAILAIAPFSNLLDYFKAGKTQLIEDAKLIANRNALEGEGAPDPPFVTFQYPTPENPERYPVGRLTSFLIRLPEPPEGQDHPFVAYNAVCTHLNCIVKGYVETFELAGRGETLETVIPCVCHGSIFDAENGIPVGGPAPLPLPRIQLEVDENGDVFATALEGTIGVGRQ